MLCCIYICSLRIDRAIEIYKLTHEQLLFAHQYSGGLCKLELVCVWGVIAVGIILQQSHLHKSEIVMTYSTKHTHAVNYFFPNEMPKLFPS